MKKFFLIITFSLLTSGIMGTAGFAAEQGAPETQEQIVSYGIGLDIGRDLIQQDIELDRDLLLQGIRDGLSGQKPLLEEEEIEKARQQFMEERAGVLKKEREAAAEENRKEEEAFLKANAEKEGVVVLPSGLQYQVLTPGTGEKPSAEDNVKVHYRGYFPDGTEFENTYTNNQPAVFPVRGVIPAWTEALQRMQEGAKWELYVPSKLAYGPQGAGKAIGPNKMLIFEIEFLGIH